jgi:pilus assembly protein Flp/PilA
LTEIIVADDRSIIDGGVCRLLDDESGVTAIEYALVAGLIALAIAAVLPMIGAELVVPFQTIANNL